MNADMNVKTSSMLAKHHVYDNKLYTHVLFKHGSIKYSIMHMHDVHCKTIVSLFSTDPTLTHANISTVMATVPLEGNELGNWVLRVPESKRKEIHQQSSSAAQERERLIHYYLNYSPYAIWSHLAGRLYRRQHHDALSATKKFIKREPGEFMCVITMYVCMPARKNQLWYYRL